jgi:thioesterase domain-containing protein
MVSGIYNEMGIRVPLIEVFKTPSIRKLSKYIQGAQPTAPGVRDMNLVLLKWCSKDAHPLFFVHDGTGEVEAYIELCNHLKSEFNFNCWGIRADRLNHYTPKNLNTREIARNYIKKIKKIQPHGPYYIVGYCIGGNIAFEIVRQWEQQNETIKFLLLIDSPPPMQELKNQTRPFTLESETELLSTLLTDDKIKNKLNEIDKIEKVWPFVCDYLTGAKFDMEMIRKIFPRDWARGLPHFKELDLNELIYNMNMIRTFINTGSYYVPANKISTQMHYIVPARSNLENRDFWNRYSHPSIQFHKTGGDHFSIFQKPGVGKFAGKLGKLLSLLE